MANPTGSPLSAKYGVQILQIFSNQIIPKMSFHFNQLLIASILFLKNHIFYQTDL